MQISNGPIFQEPSDAGIKHDSNNEHVSCYTILKRRRVCCPQLRAAFIKQTNKTLPNIHSEPFTKISILLSVDTSFFLVVILFLL